MHDDEQSDSKRSDLFRSKESKKFDENRISSNKELVKILSGLVETHQSLRFSQLLDVFRFVERKRVDEVSYWSNEFAVESSEILKRVKESVKQLQNT